MRNLRMPRTAVTRRMSWRRCLPPETARPAGMKSVSSAAPCPVRSEKPCNQDVGLGPIELLACHVIADRRDLEAPALPVVQDGGKDAWAVKTWHAEPID